LEANVEQEVRVDADLDTLATAFYARTDDLLKSGSPGIDVGR